MTEDKWSMFMRRTWEFALLVMSLATLAWLHWHMISSASEAAQAQYKDQKQPPLISLTDDKADKQKSAL